jgi:exopolysaccharide biosynthesis polyprenyl glycosylphosphotransferase
MSSPFIQTGQIPPGRDWAARLIPGAATGCGKKKPTRETNYSFRSSREDVPRWDIWPKIKANASDAGVFRRFWRWGKQWARFLLEWIAGSHRHWRELSAASKSKGKISENRVAGMRGTRNVLIVGAGDLGRRIADSFSKQAKLGRTVCGFLDDRSALRDGVIGRTADLAKLARAGFIDEVILAAPHDRELTLRVLGAARELRLDVKMATDLFGCRPAGEMERIGGIPLISLHEEQVPNAGLLAKRTLDVVVAGGLLTLLAPVLALLAMLVKLDPPGPVFYAALRAGRKGKPFRCYKFRTMVQDADQLKGDLRERNQRQGPIFKIAGDPRITRVGRFLRRYSLDELPQLLNVLKGEMSLVGPRPHPLDEFSAYAIEDLPRLDVTPGMTGLWQVTARQNPSFQMGMNLDIEYIQRWSFGMDLKILVLTAGAVLRGSGE